MTYTLQIMRLPTSKISSDFNLYDDINCFRFQLEKLLKTSLPDFRFTYFKKSPEGVFLDDITNLRYGDNFFGFKLWQDLHPFFDIVDSEDTNTKIIKEIETGEILGYVLIERLSGISYSNIKRIYDDCYKFLCSKLGICHPSSFVYFNNFIFQNFKKTSDCIDDFICKINIMIDVYEKYQNDYNYMKKIDFYFGTLKDDY